MLVSSDFLPNLEEYGAWFDNSHVDFTELAHVLKESHVAAPFGEFLCLFLFVRRLFSGDISVAVFIYRRMK
jgi:hypothetical protein